jgi:hypothetical protein
MKILFIAPASNLLKRFEQAHLRSRQCSHRFVRTIFGFVRTVKNLTAPPPQPSAASAVLSLNACWNADPARERPDKIRDQDRKHLPLSGT